MPGSKPISFPRLQEVGSHLLHLLAEWLWASSWTICLSISPFMNIKNWEGSEMLPYLQTSKLACHTFIDAGRIHETPGSEMNDSLLLKTTAVARVSACITLVPWAPVPTGRCKNLHLQCDYRRGTLSSGKLLFAPEGDSISPKAACYMFSKMWGML